MTSHMGHGPLSTEADGSSSSVPEIIEEIEVEDLAVDGICGVY